MLSTNIKMLRKTQGLSQEELALKLHVVRQTVSKWEKGLSVPDADMLLVLAEVLDTSVSTLLGEDIPEQQADELKTLATKLERINQQLADQRHDRQKRLQIALIALCTLVVLLFIFFITLDGSYLNWDSADPELMIVAVGLHALEWVFVRIAPLVLVLTLYGLYRLRSHR